VNNWPPKDWRALLALVFSIVGAVVLTVFLWYGFAQLLPKDGWTERTEASRAYTARWVLWIVAGAIAAVLLGLGMAINRRSFKGNIGQAGFDFQGGDENASPAAAAQATANAAGEKAAEIASQGDT
jgi:hypothetical protein